ncbi:TonB-dependent receptor domain-containing protein [Sphingomonas sp. M1-B02]|uniref:TonB-dependent receptor domain-containing protein n=1 Tax=Sphingomonas sp. M1-B02 TaxID=3114300 RepID=UPI00223F37A4|nr:TonB-dependent receptor [Sphingomonas sp. S6-11]UZK66609.1 TonB-dependent receptor [Sphingomonas sp. S6-11]
MKQRIISGGSIIAIAIAAISIPQTAFAQAADPTPGTPLPSAVTDQGAPPISEAQDQDEAPDIVVVGSQIRGASTGALPVSVVTSDDIVATGAVSANDLFRTIPQAGAVSFTGLPSGAGQNAARGDVSTVSLRGLGLGTTLVLLNGRRVVQHPTTVNVDGAPQISYNVNTIPIAGLERVEILRDGAAALYGSDAIAGVVNTVLSEDLKGGAIDLQHGFAEGTQLKETTLNASYGSDFAGGRGHFSVLASVYAREAELYTDVDYLASQDVRPLIGDPAFSSLTNFDGRQQASPWAQFLIPSSARFSGAVRQNATALTSTGGVFSFVPCSNGANLPATSYAGVCFRNGANTGNVDRNTRSDIPRAFPQTTAVPRARRANIFLFGQYELSDDVELFSEASYYYAKTRQLDQNAQIVSAFPITVAANAYWNPFGPVGSPNRLPGLNIPAAGLPVTITAYAPFETGPREVEVRNDQFRLLAGLRGELGNWDWQTAALYSEARVRDVSDAVSNTLFQAAVNRTTADAYNPFSGGNPLDPSGADTTLSSADDFLIKGTRTNKTSLGLMDFKVSNGKLLPLWAGDVGIAFGIEVRRETYSDDRDEHQDGTITFRDTVNGNAYNTDFAMSSPRPDVSGRRTVFSAYGELAIPLVNEEMNIPLIRKVDVQLAGRYERYSDVGSVAKPKVAVAWDLFDGLRLRGSASGGFRAPTLEALNIPPSGLTSNGNFDFVRCEADLRARRISTWSACTQQFTVSSTTSGNRALRPETSQSYSVGVVFEPKFIPASWGRFTFTADRFWINLDNVVSSLNVATLLQLDYLARVTGGSSDSIVRAPVTADDVALFAGTGIAPVGVIQFANTQYQNLQPLKIEGMDFSLSYASPLTSIGRFNINLNVSEMIKYQQDPLIPQQTLLDAQAAGTISNGFVAATGTGNLVGLGTRPKWRGTATVNWSLDNWQVGAFVQYTDPVKVTAILDANRNMFTVNDQTTTNLYASYTFDGGTLDGTKLTVGARNVFNQDPPIANGGYLGGLYQSFARYWYASVGYKF